MALTNTQKHQICKYLGYPTDTDSLALIPTPSAELETSVADALTKLVELETHLHRITFVPHGPGYIMALVQADRLTQQLEFGLAMARRYNVWRDWVETVASISSPLTTPLKSLPDPFCSECPDEPIESATVPQKWIKDQIWIDTSVTPNRTWKYDGTWWVGMTGDGANKNVWEVDIEFSFSVTADGTIKNNWSLGPSLPSLAGVVIEQAELVCVYDNASGGIGNTGYFAVGICNSGGTAGVTGRRLQQADVPTFTKPSDRQGVPDAPSSSVVVSGGTTTTNEVPVTRPDLTADEMWYLSSGQVNYAYFAPLTSYNNFGVTLKSIGPSSKALKVGGVASFRVRGLYGAA